MMATDRPSFPRPTARVLFAPAVSADPRVSGVVLAALRVLGGLLWLYNVSWKRPPDFGEDNGAGLYRFTSDAVEHPVFAPYSWVVEHLVLPQFQAFGWVVLATETALAVLLLTGTLVRLAALLGIAQSLAIALSVAQTPGEWPWSYWMMIGIHVVLLGTAAGAVASVDAVRAARAAPPDPADPTPRRAQATRLLLGWGALVALAGAVALVMSIGEDPLAPDGAPLGGPDFSVSLGSYNLLGALALLSVGALLIAAAATGRTMLARAGAGLAVLAALSLYAQLGFTDPLLGGTNTSAAFFLCAAVVGVGASARRSPSHSIS
jgi:hypothetical protein